MSCLFGPSAFIIGLFLIIFAPNAFASNQALYVYQDGKTDFYGFKNSKGNAVISAQYDKVFADNGIPLFTAKESDDRLPTLVAVAQNNRIWWVDRTGKKVFESFFFDNGPDYFEKGLSRILKQDKFGFINKKGAVIIPPQYDFASPFNERGLAYVCKGCWMRYPPTTKFPIAHRSVPSDVYGTVTGGKWGIISSKGQVIVPLVHTSSEEADKALRHAGEKKS